MLTTKVTGGEEGSLTSGPTAPSPPVHRFVYARHGRDCCGVQVPCTSLGVLRRSSYQMIASIDKVLDEGNCGRATDRGEEACECVRKYRPVFAVGHILVKAARLRTETSYKAGSGRRVSTTSRSRSQTPVQVNDELAQRSITLLSGETCQAACKSPHYNKVRFAPTSKACLKGWNVAERSTTGEAGVSRGRSNRSSKSNRDGKGRTMKNKEEPSTDSLRGNSSSLEETTGSLSQPGSTVAAQVEKPALSLILESLMEAAVDESNTEPAVLTLLWIQT